MKFKVFILIMILSSLITGCEKKDETTYSRNGFALGTVVQIKLYGGGSEEVLDQIFDRLQSIEDHMSINLASSEVSKINEFAGLSKVEVSEDTFHVIEKSITYSKLSDGKFDVTVGPLVQLWGIGTDSAKLPEKSDIEKSLDSIDYTKIELFPQSKSVYLKNKTMMIDLGGIAKGYAADEIVNILKEKHIGRAIINLGGNVYAYGKKSNSSDWNIGIQDPFSENGKSIGTIAVEDKTVVSSGIYERYFEENGKIYHHILDTSTGYPIENELMQVSVIASSSIDADALSTVMFSLGHEQGIKLAESLDDVELIFVTKDKEIYCTDGIKSKFVLTDTSFTMK